MAGKDIIGISVDSINKAIVDIYTYSTEIQHLLNDADDVVEKLKPYFDCRSGREFQAKYKTFSANYSTVVQNILEYTNELRDISNAYKRKTMDIADDISGMKVGK